MRNKSTDDFWNDARRELVRAGWAAGDSAATIAQRLSDLTGGRVTRSAVMGIVHRSGWAQAGRPTRVRAERVPRERSVSRETEGLSISKPKEKPRSAPNYTVTHRAPEAGAAQPELPRGDDGLSDPAARKPLLDLGPGECRWPYGDGPFLHCAAATYGAGRYCAAHTIASVHGTLAARAASAKLHEQQPLEEGTR